MTTHQKQVVRYSISFKQKVVKEIEEGLSIASACRLYDIKGGQTVQSWLKKLGKNHLLNKIVRVEMKGEKDKVKELEAEIKRLKITLADTAMHNHLLENILKLASEHYGSDIKKNLGPQLSGKVTNNKNTL